MRGFTKNNSSFIHFGENAQSKIRFVFGMFVLSAFMVFLSVTAAMGYGTSEPLINKLQTNQTETTQTQTDEAQEESSTSSDVLLGEEESLTQLEKDQQHALESYGPAEQSINNFNATNAGNGSYNIHWIRPTAAATEYTTPVKYLNIADDSAISAFQTTDEYRNWAWGAQITSETSYGNGPNLQSHWDVRYFEDIYSADGKTWSYAGSAITYTATGGTTKTVQMTKLAYAGDNNNYRWYYRNDLSSENESTNGWVQINDCSDARSVQVFLYFKDVSNQDPSDTDFTVTWSGSNNFGHGYVQYVYSTATKSQTPSEADTHKMLPPFAADMTMPANTSQNNIAGMTMKNYCGRYVKQPIAGGYLPCVYRESWVAFVPKGTTPAEVTWISTYGVTIARQNAQGAYYFYLRDANGNWTRQASYAAESYDVWINMIYGASISTDLSNSGYTWATVDSIDKGIEINMFDYDAWRTLNGSFANLGINSYSDFKFSNGNQNQIDPAGYNNFNIYTGDGVGRRAGIFSNVLGPNGFPLLKTSATATVELDYLFDTSKEYRYRKTYKKMNHLFNKPYYDQTGYYFYDSAENSSGQYTTPGNFAQIRKRAEDTVDNDFIVYSEPSNITGTDPPKFMPFDDKDNVTADNRDYLFGMTLNTDFIQPKDGIITEGGEAGPMVFNFNGDDDELVYLDGVLIMDIGGIHQPDEATINFEKGYVKYDDTHIDYMYDLYDAAGKSDVTSWVSYEEGGVTHYRYADYTNHTLNFFYLERGSGASNLRLAFNMPTRPAGSILLGKDVVNEGSVAHVDGDFSYKVQVSKFDDDTQTYGAFQDYVSPLDEQGNPLPVKVYEGTTTYYDPSKLVKEVVMTADSHGQIDIKDGTVAILNGFSVKDKFKIVEYDPRETAESQESRALDLLWKVYWNDREVPESETIDIEYYDPETHTTKNIKGYGTENLIVGTEPGIQFHNHVNQDSLFDLHIKKTGKDEANSVISLSFDERPDPGGGDPVRVMYSGPYYYVRYDEDQEKYVVIGEEHTTERGRISLQEGGDNAEVVIPDVQMDARANLMVEDLTTHKTVLYWVEEFVEPATGEPYPSGSMSNPQPSNHCSTNKFYAQIPFYLGVTPESREAGQVRQVNYGTINLEIANLQDSLKVAKICDGPYASRSKEFELSVIIKDDAGNFIPSRQGTTESPYYNASIYKIESDPQDIPANFNSQGELIISYDGGTTWEYPKLRDTEYILVDSVIDDKYPYITGFEESLSGYTITFNEITTEELDIPMTQEYLPLTPAETSYLTTQSFTLLRVGTDDDTNSVAIKNTYDTPPTGLDLFKNPQLIAFLVAILLTLLIAGPLKLFLSRRRRKQEYLKFDSIDEDLFKDDYSW